jgi:hypothetical protein
MKLIRLWAELVFHVIILSVVVVGDNDDAYSKEATPYRWRSRLG